MTADIRAAAWSGPRLGDEVGGDFELVRAELLADEPARPPWEAGGRPVTYVGSGRQALTLAARAAATAGHAHLLAPAYLCDSMLAPFVAEGFTVEGVPVDHRLHMRADFLAAALSGARRPALLHGSYFGQSTPSPLAAVLREAASRGAFVVNDETHRLFGPPEEIGTLRVGSLRKLLPVPDGGYVVGLHTAVTGADPEEHDGVRERMHAMGLKSEYLSAEPGSRSPGRHLQAYRTSERLLHEGPDVRQLSAVTRWLVERLRYDEMAARRRANAQALLAGLRPRLADGVLNPPDERTAVPSHLVLSGVDAVALQAAMAARGIFCPIHWPPPQLIRGPGPWPTSYLSVPVDQRYDADDMARVARALNRHDGPPPGGTA